MPSRDLAARLGSATRAQGGGHREKTVKSSVLVLGAGMVGTCTALHLARRGHDVTLVDRREPGRETSYGNAGVIQREAVEPYAFPRGMGALLNAGLGRDSGINYHWGALARGASYLGRYWRNSAPDRYPRIAAAYARLIEHALDEHQPLIEASQGEDLVRRGGYLHVFRDERSFAAAAENAQRVRKEYGLTVTALDAPQARTLEPALHARLAGALHWTDPWSVTDPGELVARYARQFQQLGGTFVTGDAQTLRETGAGWKLVGSTGAVEAENVVVALGPWAQQLVRPLGYRLPLFVKRGYHRHFHSPRSQRIPVFDADRGYVIAPMRQGVRITTGAEFALLEAPPTPRQLALVERFASELVELGSPVEVEPWIGARPCTVDMLPVIGRAPNHRNVWFNFGHGHQGFTLGPASGRLLAEMIDGVPAFVDPEPYSPARFC